MPDGFNRSRNLPSTYQEVLKMLGMIYDTILPKLELLNKAVFNESPTSDVVMDVDENDLTWLKVLGITINTTRRDIELIPKEYIRDITFELKSASAIGLKGKEGFSHAFVFLMTARANKLPEAHYPTWQVAIGDVNMALYFRTSATDNEWNSWIQVLDIVRMLNEHPEEIDRLSHRQLIQSDNEPIGQVEGDYWLQPIFPSGYFFQNVDNPSIVDEVTFEDYNKYVFQNLDGSDTEMAAGDVDNYLLVDATYNDPIPEPPPVDPDPPEEPTIIMPFFFEGINGSSDHQATNKDVYLLQNLDGSGTEEVAGNVEEYALFTPDYPDLPEPPPVVDPEPDVPVTNLPFVFVSLDDPSNVHQATTGDRYIFQNLGKDGFESEVEADGVENYELVTPEYNDPEPDPPQPPVDPPVVEPDPIVPLPFMFENTDNPSDVHQATTGDSYIFQSLDGTGTEAAAGSVGDYELRDLNEGSPSVISAGSSVNE